MGILTSFKTKAIFDSFWANSDIRETALNFILDTGQLYTHGIMFNSVLFGTETTNSIIVNVGGTSKTLSLSGHTHSNYHVNTANLDISTYKLVSGLSDLIQLVDDNIKIGNSTNPTYIYGLIKSIRDNTNYTVLDTGNFSIIAQTISGNPLSNVATFLYGSSKFLLDYVKRLNTVSAFDAITSYTCMGTTNVDNKVYGYITLKNDGDTLNPKYAQIRVDTTLNTIQYRSSGNTSWSSILAGGAFRNLTINGDIYAIATTSATLPDIKAPTTFGTNGQVLGTTGTAFEWKTIESDPQYSATLSGVSLTTSWSDVDNLNSRLDSAGGSYVVQITYASCIYTGTFSYVLGGAIDDEIILHCSGTLDSVGGATRGRLYAKIGTTSGTTYLRLATSLNENNANLSIKYRKLI